MEFASTVDFAQAARTLTRATRRLGLSAPSFRCPPRLAGADRSIRRRPSSDVVSVRVKGRPRAAVFADMIEGVVAANRLVTPEADRLRTELWTTLGATAPVAAPVAAPASARTPGSRPAAGADRVTHPSAGRPDPSARTARPARAAGPARTARTARPARVVDPAPIERSMSVSGSVPDAEIATSEIATTAVDHQIVDLPVEVEMPGAA